MSIVVKNKPGRDLIGRTKEIESLTHLIQNVKGPLVLSLNGAWGTGKTTFIELWQSYLDSEKASGKKGITNVYFNAWESDFVDDPLIPLMAKFDELNGDVKSAKWVAAKNLLPKLAKIAVGASVKLMTLNALDISEISEGVIGDAAQDGAKDLVENFIEQTEATRTIRDAIGTLVENKCDGQANLIIFIDELDRCRPTYSIELLERIKHLFSVENVIFVLVFDKEQLCHSICSVYGSGFNSGDYLKRFIDVELTLRDPSVEKYIRQTVSELPYSLEFKSRCDWVKSQEVIVEIFSFLAIVWSTPLRQINQLLTRFMLVSCMEGDEGKADFALAAILIFIREKLPEEYKRFLMRPSDSVKKLISLVEAIMPPELEFHKGRRHYLAKLISLCRENSDSGEATFEALQAPYIGIIETSSNHSAEKQFYRSVVTGIRNLSNFYDDGGAAHLLATAKRVELTESVKLDGNIESVIR